MKKLTRGVDIQPWLLSCPFPDGLSRDVNIHFWDFAGQEIFHLTSQFFLTKRSLYLFVWDPRKDEETRTFDYMTLSQMPHLLDKLPKRWMDIRNELKARKDDYITGEDYFAVCRSHAINKEKALFLSHYLHDLGIILHFRMDSLLADTVILKPEWATDAVYAMLDSLEIQQNNGRFNRIHLSRYWDKKKYPAEKYTLLLRLIEKLELSSISWASMIIFFRSCCPANARS